MLHQFRHNLLSGVFASLASCCSKVGLDFDSENSTVRTVLLPMAGLDPDSYFALGLRCIFIALMIWCNILMLRFYVLSM